MMVLLTLVLGSARAANERLEVNDAAAPVTRQDLESIQGAVTRGLVRARAATVCLEVGEGSGSGVIVSADGLILTAAHVTGGVGKLLAVVLEDGTRLCGKSLGLVAATDAAMIRIVEPGTYPFVEIDRSRTTRLGDWVFALGHAGGFDKDRGSVVRLGRLVRIANSTFQSDCILIGGDSGGPLFDLTGRLVAIHSRVGEQLQVNMHVPMSEFMTNWDGMMRAEFIGVGAFATKEVVGNGFLGLSSVARPTGGLRVTKVGHPSPAFAAGVRVGDVLLQLNGVPLVTREQLQRLLSERSASDTITLELERDGKPHILTFNLGDR